VSPRWGGELAAGGDRLTASVIVMAPGVRPRSELIVQHVCDRRDLIAEAAAWR
jgi:NAD(P)H-nitrite reductase large subunit